MTPSDFRPPTLLRNGHVQTVLGVLLPGPACPRPQRRHVVSLGDGDALLLHENTPRRWQSPQPIALLIHGLTGSHISTHIQRLAVLLLERQVRTFRIDLRGAGDGVALARGSYHAGRSEDIRAALAYLHTLEPASPLWLAGVSLGGNASLKLAGELPRHPAPGLSRVAVINPPIDLDRCSALIERPKNRFYERRFLRELVRADQARRRLHRDLPDFRFPQGLTIRGFDDLVTAPRNGFEGVADYYRRASSFPVIEQIPIPTLILTARDDPFIAVEPFEELRVPPNVQVQIARHGGHVGYIGVDGRGVYRWAERRLVDWLSSGYISS